MEASSITVKDWKVVGGKDDDMWERLVEEAKTTKRQWAGIEDSDKHARAQNVVVVGIVSKE